MRRILDTFVFRGEQPVEIREVSGKFLNEEDFYIEARQMSHGTPCNAYVFVEKGKIKIDRKKLAKAKLPSMALLKKLKQGKDIIYNGKTYRAKDLTFEEDNKKIVFVLDTGMSKNIIDFVKDADVLICEATFLHASERGSRLAGEYKHLTAKQAAEIAKKANVKKLVLTHLSQRYEKNPEKILKEARKVFKKAFLANDLDILEI